MIVVFGGTGFIGSHLVALLRARGMEVEVVTHRPERCVMPGMRFGDLERPDSLIGAVRGARVVVQSTTFPNYPFEKASRGMTFERYDFQGTERVLAAARQAGVERYIYVSGVGAGAEARQPYFRAIHKAEAAIAASGISYASLRPTFVYGPRDHGFNKILAAARVSPVLPAIGLEARHQPVFVGDVAEALRRLIEPGAPSGVFEIGGPERMSAREMIDRVFELTGVRARLIPVPQALARFGGALLERLPGELLTKNAIDFACEDFVADTRALEQQLGMRLTPFIEGLSSYLLTGPKGPISNASASSSIS